MDVRFPAVAGGFYPSTKEQIQDKLKELFRYWDIDYSQLSSREQISCLGLIVPHAGYDYSGYVAAKTYSQIPDVDTVVIMGPNHYGAGPDFSVSSAESWRTPFGKIDVHSEFAKDLVSSSVCEFDDFAHEKEHSIEVQLPFLQSVLKDFKIVPVSIKNYAADNAFLIACKSLGKTLAELIEKSEEHQNRVLIVASTDFTHYEPESVAEQKDDMAIAAIEDLDEQRLFETISKYNISMCGYGGVCATISACKVHGSKKAQRVAYMTSADTTGNTQEVVGYGGMRIL